jgi:ankyrin repeat protein
MQYAPSLTPAPDTTASDHGHGHSHDHGAGGEQEQESGTPIRELLSKDYSSETKDMTEADWRLLTERDENGFLRFHFAVLDNMIPLCVGLLQRYPQIVNDVANIRKQSPLHWACLKNRLAMVVLLMEHGADPNLLDTEGYTPLTTAVQFNLVPIAHYLVTKVCSNKDKKKFSK